MQEGEKELRGKYNILTNSAYLIMPRSVLVKSLTGSVSVVVVAVVMVFHQTTPIQQEQTVIQAVYQLTCKVKESVNTGIRWEVIVLSSLVQYISISKQRIYIPNRVNSMENVFITYLVFSFLGLLFLLWRFYGTTQANSFWRLISNTEYNMVEEWNILLMEIAGILPTSKELKTINCL